MARQHVPLFSFNRGMVSPLALARTDIPRTALSAEVQTNYMPRVLGSMMLRPGWQYITASQNDKKAFHIPFVFATSDTANLQITEDNMRVIIDDVLVSRASVSTTVQSGDFSSDVGWNDIDESGATSTIASNKLTLVGTGFASAGRSQGIGIAGGDMGVEHALRIVVDQGPVTFRLGTTNGGDELIAETTLGTGTHSIAFTPNVATVYFQFTSVAKSEKIISSCEIEAAGTLEIPTPWAEDDLKLLRYDQSADVIYVSCRGYQSRKIERRTTRSWSLVKYEPEDGPFRVINTSTLQITPSAISGNITLTASRALFTSGHVGALFKLTSIGQQVEQDVTAENQWSDDIRVQGVGSSQRSFDITRAGTWSGTVTLQRSVGEPGSWVDVQTYTSNGTTSYNDGLDNQIVFYRIGINSGDYTSGTAELSLTYANGNISGVVRITAFTNETTVDAAVLRDLGGTAATSDWQEGEWSGRRGYPSANALFEGRLGFGGNTKLIASVSDAYESFDEDVEGDSAPLSRSIGQGPVDRVNWLLALNRLILGTDGAEWSARSSSLDEPLTVTNFSLKAPSTEGSSDVGARKVGDSGLFVDRSGVKLMRLNNSGDVTYGDYAAGDLTEIVPEIGEPSMTRIEVQRRPDTRIHCVRSDGKVAVLVDEPAEDVLCWVLIETDGIVEDVVILPGLVEDQVYYMVKRTINGSTKRYLEKWALESECQGDALNKQADSFIVYDDAATTTITGLSHLEGESVVVWADGKDKGTFTVSGGQITLTEAVSQAVVGLTYTAQYKSTKLAYAASMGTALTQKKKVDHVGFIMRNTHANGIRYGKDFNNLDGLPRYVEGALVDQDTVHEEYDVEGHEFNGEWDTDSRLCLQSQAPRPCTLLAAVVGMNTNG